MNQEAMVAIAKCTQNVTVELDALRSMVDKLIGGLTNKGADEFLLQAALDNLKTSSMKVRDTGVLLRDTKFILDSISGSVSLVPPFELTESELRDTVAIAEDQSQLVDSLDILVNGDKGKTQWSAINKEPMDKQAFSKSLETNATDTNKNTTNPLQHTKDTSVLQKPTERQKKTDKTAKKSTKPSERVGGKDAQEKIKKKLSKFVYRTYQKEKRWVKMKELKEKSNEIDAECVFNRSDRWYNRFISRIKRFVE